MAIRSLSSDLIPHFGEGQPTFLESEPGDQHCFFYSSELAERVFDDPLYREIIHGPAFARLAEVRFLGAIDYVLFSQNVPKNRRHTRFDHSVGVGRLALLFSKLAGLTRDQERLLVVAALLHDIGHGPLSHSLEPTFSDTFKLNHHSVTTRVIRGEVPLGASLFKTLRRAGIDVNVLAGVIDGTYPHPSALLINGAINLDTIEGIARCYACVTGAISSRMPDRVVRALVRLNDHDILVLDEFWRMKGFVYNYIIQSEVGLIADYVCRRYLTEHKNSFLGGALYFRSEEQLRRLQPDLFSQLADLRRAAAHGHPSVGSLEYHRREFYIDDTIVPQKLEDLAKRYLQRKHTHVLKDRRQ